MQLRCLFLNGHGCALLPDGTVLVVGGNNYYNNSEHYLSDAWLYDARSNTWTATGGLHTPRGYISASLLPGGRVLVAGGLNSTNYPSSAEIYDPISGAWVTAAPLEGDTGIISRAKRPLPWARAARCWLRKAKASWSEREI